jgi:hypothetical protein
VANSTASVSAALAANFACRKLPVIIFMMKRVIPADLAVASNERYHKNDKADQSDNNG